MSEVPAYVKKNICIVTPDAIPAIANGGIGTHVLYLSRVLAQKHRVTVLFAAAVPGVPAELPAWCDWYGRWGVQFEMLDVESRCGTVGDAHFSTSMATYNWLSKHKFDMIHFQDWQANGFHSIRAKRALGAFQESALCLTMHSNTEWINEGMRQWTPAPKAFAKVAWMERYCHKHCDILISPSQHMFSWAKKRNWELCSRRVLLPNCFLDASPGSVGKVDATHLTFFGRLETRKGLRIFCDAIDKLSLSGNRCPSAIAFLGKHGQVDGESSAAFLQRFAKKHSGRLQVEIAPNLDAFQAMEYLKKNGSVAVISSLSDNFPYTVVECIENRIPFIASDAGGISEAAEEEVLFHPDADSLAAKIREIPGIDFLRVGHHYNAGKANAGWEGFVDSWTVPQPRQPVSDHPPLVSICVAYYNHGKYLGQLLKSIQDSSYVDYEVVIVNDGSTDSFSNEVFEDLARRRADDGRWRFIHRPNGGVSAARNTAAAEARGKYIIFMDADNCARPEMLSTFVAAMERSGADCLTCHFEMFQGDGPPDSDTEVFYRATPLGACLEVGLCENVFGDANFIIKKSVFEESGGFTVIPRVSWEDYELLARLVLSGKDLDVIPRPLFWYRHLNDSFSRVTSQYANQCRIVEAYADYAPLRLREMYRNLLAPTFFGGSTSDLFWMLIRNAFPLTMRRGRVARRLYYWWRMFWNR